MIRKDVERKSKAKIETCENFLCKSASTSIQSAIAAAPQRPPPPSQSFQPSSQPTVTHYGSLNYDFSRLSVL